MQLLEINNLTFYYPEQEKATLSQISFSVKAGEFVVLAGPSGCGKSTLLRQLKTVLAPHGVRRGELFFNGTPIEAMDHRTQSALIGFVQQSPENQLVTDKVWHELAFGLESLGLDNALIRARVAEMASFFGIQNWYDRNVTELSGGQKQLLNLAAVMVMQPSLLILDEPASQLDPIAAHEFLETVSRINRELGTTVLMTEHRLEEVFPLADRVLTMDRGQIICDASPEKTGRFLKARGHAMFAAMPSAMRLYAALDASAFPCPVTVREGRDLIEKYAETHAPGAVPPECLPERSAETVISVDGVRFRYEKNLPDVLRGVSLTVKRGDLMAILGGNGTGKSTTLSVITGLLKPYRGRVRTNGRVSLLSQDPQTLFLKKTVREDLFEVFSGMRSDAEAQEKKVREVVGLCRLGELLDRHPYDLSGGEQQRAALAKLLLTEPEVLLLDEPTKDLDADFKAVLAGILREFCASGRTVLMVSHDVEFCAEYATRCGLFFNGELVTENRPRAFFAGNSFYTTAANRMARELLPGAVTVKDIVDAFGGPGADGPEDDGPGDDGPGDVGPEDDGSKCDEAGGNEPRKDESGSGESKTFESESGESETFEPESDELEKGEPRNDPPTAGVPQILRKKKTPLSLPRKLGAVLFGLIALASFIFTVTNTDLSALIGPEGLKPVAGRYLAVYAALIASLAGVAACVSRRAEKVPAPPEATAKKRLSRRTALACLLILLLIPVTILVTVCFFGEKHYYLLSVLVLLEAMAPFALIFENRKPKARELVVIAVLSALGVAGRALFFMLPNFKPVIALVIISGVAFGGETGFLVGAMTMLLSNMIFGQGPWTPFQMFAMGLIGLLSGVLFRKGLLGRSRGALCAFGVLSAIVIYGGLMNPASALMWGSAETLTVKTILAYYLSGFPVDCIQAAATALFLWFGAEVMLEKLDRIKVKYGLAEKA